MNKNNTFRANFLYFCLILLGLILCLLFFYLNFIRGRLPRDIPFILSEFRFYALLYLLFIYLFIIKQHIYYKPPKPIILKIISIITTPFIFFDAFFKHNKVMYDYYFKVVSYVSKLVKSYIFINDTMLLFFLFNLMPRIILLLIFMVDVFWLKKIEVFYYCIILSAIPLTYNYIKYSIEFAIEQYTKQLEAQYISVLISEEGNFLIEDVIIDNNDHDEKEIYGKHNPNAIYHDTFVSIRKYIEIQADTFIRYSPDDATTHYRYTGSPALKQELFSKYLEEHQKTTKDLTDDDDNNLDALFNLIASKIVNLYIFILVIKKMQTSNIINQMKIVIYSLYFITWLYIFILSISSLSDISVTLKVLQIMTEYSNVFDPFS